MTHSTCLHIRNSVSRSLLLAVALFALLLTGATALAHEIKHDLHQHDDASCVLHLHANQTDKVISAAPFVVPLSPRHLTPASFPAASFCGRNTAPFHARAPPSSSRHSIV